MILSNAAKSVNWIKRLEHVFGGELHQMNRRRLHSLSRLILWSGCQEIKLPMYARRCCAFCPMICLHSRGIASTMFIKLKCSFGGRFVFCMWIYEISYIWTAEKDMKTWLIIAVIYNLSSREIKAWKKKNSGLNESNPVQAWIFVSGFITTA